MFMPPVATALKMLRGPIIAAPSKTAKEAAYCLRHGN
jgi:hypothetical protein